MLPNVKDLMKRNCRYTELGWLRAAFPPLSPRRLLPLPSDRSKAQRWVDSSPSPSSSDVPPSSRASYRDAVLPRPQAKPELHFPRPAPRSEVGFCSLPQLNADEQGWTLVRHRRSGRCGPHPLCPPRRQVSEDMRGLCFNCLLSSHRAVACRRPTRCFRILPHSPTIDQAEADLQRALLVTVGGNRPPVTLQQVLVVVGRSYNVELSRMSAMHMAPEDFLLLLPDQATTDRVLNVSSPLHAPDFSLLFKRWTRLANAAATALPIAVDVELRGVPAHSWEVSTAQVLLDGSCLVRAPLPDTAARHDLSAFGVSTWVAQLDSIPPAVNLIIPEPAPVHAELSAVRHDLLYKVQVSLLSSRDAVEDPHSPMPSSPEQGRRRRRWRRRCRSPSPRPPYSGDATGPTAPTGTTPVHSRLGSGGRHAPPDTSATDVDVAAESSGGFPSPAPQASVSSFHERESCGVVREENPSPDPVRKVPLPLSAGVDSAPGTPVLVDLDSSFGPAGFRLEHSQPKSATQPRPAAPSSALDGGLLEVVASDQCPVSPLPCAPAAVAIAANRHASTEDFELQARGNDLAGLGASVDPRASAPCPPSPVPEANWTGSMIGSRGHQPI
jgi:hypothetical protein